jgi:hypothetical protein
MTHSYRTFVRSGVSTKPGQVQAEPDSRGVHAARAAIYEARAKDAGALMTRGIFSAAARESAGRAGPDAPVEW